MVYGLGSVVGKFRPFIWLVMLRSVRIETVSINGMLIYIEIARNRTSILWKQPSESGVDKCQEICIHANCGGDTCRPMIKARGSLIK
jgi:hypothetical protein